MSRRGRRTIGPALLIAAVVLTAAAPGARAQGPEFVPLASGAFAAPPVTWQASAVRPDRIFLDIYNAESILFQTYSPQFAGVPAKRGVTALGYRPLGLPSTAALVGGVAGTRVKMVKIFFAGLPMQKLTPTPAPPEWGFRARFFAAGAIVPDSFAATSQVVTKIKALDRKGKLVSTTTGIPTTPF